MRPVVIALPGNEALAHPLAEAIDAEQGRHEMRHFPDGETYIRIDAEIADRAVLLVCTLDRPDAKLLPLLFMAATARELGASQIGLICPYLAYMRQDTRFHPGEAVTSVHFAKLLSGVGDWLVTVDPHLHRRASLDEIFTIPSKVVHAAPLISSWIRRHATGAFLIGPDSESEQWVAAVAKAASVPYTVLDKTRHGDRAVEITTGSLDLPHDRVAVLIDDIISTGGTMITAVEGLRAKGLSPPLCIGVHAVLADHADARLRAAGAREVITCNTIPHPTNRIDLTTELAEAIRGLLAQARTGS